jgi:hypothetical protein
MIHTSTSKPLRLDVNLVTQKNRQREARCDARRSRRIHGREVSCRRVRQCAQAQQLHRHSNPPAHEGARGLKCERSLQPACCGRQDVTCKQDLAQNTVPERGDSKAGVWSWLAVVCELLAVIAAAPPAAATTHNHHPPPPQSSSPPPPPSSPPPPPSTATKQYLTFSQRLLLWSPQTPAQHGHGQGQEATIATTKTTHKKHRKNTAIARSRTWPWRAAGQGVTYCCV